MKKEYRKRKNETLAQWYERLADTVLWRKLESSEIREILREVSVQSYIEASNVKIALLTKHRV